MQGAQNSSCKLLSAWAHACFNVSTWIIYFERIPTLELNWTLNIEHWTLDLEFGFGIWFWNLDLEFGIWNWNFEFGIWNSDLEFGIEIQISKQQQNNASKTKTNKNNTNKNNTNNTNKNNTNSARFGRQCSRYVWKSSRFATFWIYVLMPERERGAQKKAGSRFDT